jgi:hypothetical protein
VAKVVKSKAGGTIRQQSSVHPWLAADAHGNKQTTLNIVNWNFNRVSKNLFSSLHPPFCKPLSMNGHCITYSMEIIYKCGD